MLRNKPPFLVGERKLGWGFAFFHKRFAKTNKPVW
jgi:hypothetical protein